MFSIYFQAFQKINVNYFALELDKRDDCDAVQDVLGQLTGARSVSFLFDILSETGRWNEFPQKSLLAVSGMLSTFDDFHFCFVERQIILISFVVHFK